MTTNKMDAWDNYCGSNFLKAEIVKSENDAFVVVSITEFMDDDNNLKPRLTLERNNETYVLDLNVTNANFCRNNGVASPMKLVGKRLYFKKVLVRSPKLNKEVESLRISKIA